LRNTAESALVREDDALCIRTIISQRQFSIAYQPIYSLIENRVAGLECLTRFSTLPSRPTEEWFSEAAEVGLGVELELAVMRMALAGFPLLPADVYVAVNVSPATVLSGKLKGAIASVPADRIVLEITEHAHISDYNELMRAFQPLRNRGVRLAVDDAGAGYASLRHILSLQPHFIKLDMSLTRNIDSDTARRALASALIEFAAKTGSEIVAEGVETASELKALQALGVKTAQGYYLGRPMPLAGVSAPTHISTEIPQLATAP
jgi:EAL domain-containing protein (putative c-di-GMP-specific phosphodiesterase class I)